MKSNSPATVRSETLARVGADILLRSSETLGQTQRDLKPETTCTQLCLWVEDEWHLLFVCPLYSSKSAWKANVFTSFTYARRRTQQRAQIPIRKGIWKKHW